MTINRTLFSALKVRFRRNSLFNDSLKDINVDIGNRIASLVLCLLPEDVGSRVLSHSMWMIQEMALSGEGVLDFELFSGEQALSKATRAELHCIAGHRAYFGHGMKRNHHRALVCYRKAAELGDADGMNHLAMMMEKGMGCTQNIGDAIAHYEAAVHLENDDARYNLASLLYRHSVYGDTAAALELFKTVRGHLTETRTKEKTLITHGALSCLL